MKEFTMYLDGLCRFFASGSREDFLCPPEGYASSHDIDNHGEAGLGQFTE